MLSNKKNIIFVLAIFVAVTLFFIFRGNSTGISFDLSDETIKLSYSDKYSFSVPIKDIKNVELTEGISLGECMEGESGKTYSYGTWKNSDYGEYSLCALTKVTSYVVITDNNDEHYVFNIENASSTAEVKEALIEYMNNLK